MNKNTNQFSHPPPPVTIPTSIPNPPPSFPQTSSNQNLSNNMNGDFQNPQMKIPPDMSNQLWMLMKTVNTLQKEMRNMSRDVQVIKTNHA